MRKIFFERGEMLLAFFFCNKLPCYQGKIFGIFCKKPPPLMQKREISEKRLRHVLSIAALAVPCLTKEVRAIGLGLSGGGVFWRGLSTKDLIFAFFSVR